MVTPLRGLAGRLDWRSPASGGNRHLVTPNLTVSPLPRYTRPREETVAAPLEGIIPFTQSDPAIDASTLSAGSRALLRGLLRVGSTRMFPGGGAGIEYGGLLKTAARPDYIAAHVVEAANHLREREADLLLVPGMSGYPVGAMYALAARTPALLLKKSKLGDANPHAYPAGAFVIPSYTGEGDVVMHADPAAVEDIVATIVARKLAGQVNQPVVELELRVAGADDIIDKATMSQAVSESAVVIGEEALRRCLARHRLKTGDQRPANIQVSVVAWVTPLIKSYNRPREHLWQSFKLHPFAGLDLYTVHLDPPAIGVTGVGCIGFAADGAGAS
ncbi:MAG: hypothetical protein K0S83_53 [Thermomicrobiales bacterium]|jgi:hypothetical protein|nr:hypothetical protein [Thermomicrobiales bacterium]